MSKMPLPLKLFIGGTGYQIFEKYMQFSKLKPNVASATETINYIKKNRSSIARYGDGELLWAFQARQSGNFEKNSSELAKALRKVLTDPQPNLLIGIPNIFNGLKDETTTSKTYWEGLIIRHGYQIVHLLKSRKKYYDSRFTRIYMDSKDKNIDFESKFNSIKEIWDNRNVLIIEGNKSRFGVGNDLLDNASSIKRILCPSENAFEKYKNILSITEKIASTVDDVLILLALGPTATVLTYDLFKDGFQAIDIGHLDIEYDWYKLHAKTKISIPGKYVNEANDKFTEVTPDKLIKYNQEVIAEIKGENL